MLYVSRYKKSSQYPQREGHHLDNKFKGLQKIKCLDILLIGVIIVIAIINVIVLCTKQDITCFIWVFAIYLHKTTLYGRYYTHLVQQPGCGRAVLGTWKICAGIASPDIEELNNFPSHIGSKWQKDPEI